MEKLVFFDGEGKVWNGDIAEACALYVQDWTGVVELEKAIDQLDDEDRVQFVEVDRPGFYVWIDLYNQFVSAQDIWRWANRVEHIERRALRSAEWIPVDLGLKLVEDESVNE